MNSDDSVLRRRPSYLLQKGSSDLLPHSYRLVSRIRSRMLFFFMFQFVGTFMICSEAFSIRNYVHRINSFTSLAGKTSARTPQLDLSTKFRRPMLCRASSDESISPTEDSDTGMEDEDNYMGGQQWDEFPVADQLEDAEMIEAMRLERIIANDRWQSCLIRDKQGGEWTGNSCVLLVQVIDFFSSVDLICP